MPRKRRLKNLTIAPRRARTGVITLGAGLTVLLALALTVIDAAAISRATAQNGANAAPVADQTATRATDDQAQQSSSAGRWRVEGRMLVDRN